MNFLEVVEKYDYILKALVLVLTWVFGKEYTKFRSELKRRKLQRLLMLRNQRTVIVAPVRSGRVKLDSNVGATEIENDFITMDEALSIYDANKLIDDVSGQCLSVSKIESSNETVSVSNNVFCIGGPLSNDYAKKQFKSFFSSIKFGHPPKAKYLTNKNQKLLYDFTFEEKSDGEGCVKIGNEAFTFDRDTEGYIILIRLLGTVDFEHREHGTVHLCFGNNSITTKAAVKCYAEHCEELYRRLRKKRGHYFVMIKCSSDGAIKFKTFVDVTDKAFSSKE